MSNIVDNYNYMEPLKLVKYALDSTIALINKGEPPTKALEKVSRELELNPNYIQRVGESLNVALHYNHFKKTASDRSSDFPVADVPSITKNIFGEKETTLNTKKAQWFSPSPEEVDYNKYLTNPKFKKVANEISNTNANFDSFGTSLKGLYKKASEYISKLDKELDQLRTEKVANDAYFEACFNTLVTGFKKTAASRQAFHDFETKAVATHGERAVGYIDLIYKAANLTEDRGKHDRSAIVFNDSRELKLFDSLLKSASKVNKLKEDLSDAETYTGFQKASFKLAGYRMNSGYAEKEKTASDELADMLDVVLEKHAGAAGAVGTSLLADLFTQLGDATYGRDKKSPAFKNTKLDNVNRSTVLQELIMTDSILKHQDPKKVIQAYQQILRLAPHLAMEKEVVRSLLRSMTATQSLGPMEANQLVEGNTSYLKQHQMLHSVDDKKKDK